MQQFINNVGKFLGHFLADLGAGVFGGYLLAALDQAVDGYLLPVLREMSLFYHSSQIPLRIVDKIGQLHLFLFRNQMSEGILNLLPGNARGRTEEVDERLMLPVQVAEKVFRSLWKAADCHQVHDFTGRRLYRRVFLCQKL